MASTKTKAVAALGLLDIARQVSHAIAAKQEADRDRMGFGAGFREDASHLAHDLRDRLPSNFEWGMPPWRRKPSMGDRVATWAPVGVIAVVASVGVVAAAKWISRHDEIERDKISTDSRMVGAIKTGSHAIDAGVNKVVSGGTTAAVGTASAVAAGSTAIRSATVDRAKVELDHRVVQPAKKKAVLYGALGVLGLTLYVIIIAVIVQLVVGAIG